MIFTSVDLASLWSAHLTGRSDAAAAKRTPPLSTMETSARQSLGLHWTQPIPNARSPHLLVGPLPPRTLPSLTFTYSPLS